MHLPLFLLLPLCIVSASLRAQAAHIELPARDAATALITHYGYTLGYAQEYRQARWVAYVLSRSQLEQPVAERRDNFRPDPLLGNDGPQLVDYKGSGFDRGHLAPAADMKWDSRAMADCFFLSNMSPQTHAFNAGIWERLEDAVRDFARDFDSLWIATGPLLEKDLPTIGPNAVAVPKYYYKVLLRQEGEQLRAVGFVLPQTALSAEGLARYCVSVDSVEILTGIDFFAALDDSTESAAECNASLEFWSRRLH